MQWLATLDDGETMVITYPEPDPKQDVTWMDANADSFTTEGNNVHKVQIAPSAQGHTGILVTHQNACQGHATLNGCPRSTKCKYFHFAPGWIVSNLPGRQPQAVGLVHPAISAKAPYDTLVVWTPEKARNISLTRKTQIDQLKERKRAREEAAALKVTEQEEYEELMRDSQGASEPVAKRAHIDLQPQRQLQPLPRLMYQPDEKAQGQQNPEQPQEEPEGEADEVNAAADAADDAPDGDGEEGAYSPISPPSPPDLNRADCECDSPQTPCISPIYSPHDYCVKAEGDLGLFTNTDVSGEANPDAEEQPIVMQGPGVGEEIVPAPDADAVIDNDNKIILASLNTQA
jgi:hypothetical protein